MDFRERLNNTIERRQSLLCVGLDPDRRFIPKGISVLEFNKRIVDATHDLVCAYKPNVAFYDYLPKGHDILIKTIDYIRCKSPEIVIIGDSKRGDVDNTSEIHAKVMFEHFKFDAATVNAYPGLDGGVDAFLDFTDKGVFVWCRSSNKGAGEIQDLWVMPPEGSGEQEPRRLYEWIAIFAQRWNKAGNVGIVASATYVEELKRVRELCPDMPILIPGVGAQQGDLQRSVYFGSDKQGQNAIINVSRNILYDPKRDADNFDSEARLVASNLLAYMRQEIRVGFKQPAPL